ncbi:MAG: hydantoinase/oxoprolinase family protein, partial [Pseudomonadota bacterium]
GDPTAPDWPERLRCAFEEAYKMLYGRLVPGGAPECMTFSVNVAAAAPELATAREGEEPVRGFGAEPVATRTMIDPATGEGRTVGVYPRDDLAEGAHVEGPAVIVEDETTIVLPATFRARVGRDGIIDCTRKDARP